MASTTLTGSYSGSSATQYAIRCVCSSTSNGSTANTSNVTVTLQMRRTNGTADGGNWQWNLTGGATGRIVINGNDSGNRSVTFDTRWNVDWITLTTYTVNNIAHNSDGSKSINIKAYFEPNATASLSGGYVNGTFVLDTIPRATTPTLSATSVAMTGRVKITLTPASSSFKHKLRYAFGSLTGQTNGFSIGADFSPTGTTTVDFYPPASLANQITTATSGTCTITCYTYNSSGTQIGSATTITLTVNVPDYTLTGSVALTGNNLLSGAYVQGKSTVNAVITAGTSYGATIKSYSSIVDGKTYTGQTFTSSALSNGSKTVSVTITDSRNKTLTFSSSSFTVYEYSAPYITSFNVERQSDGTTVVAKLVGGVSAVNNKNTKSFKITLHGVTNTLTSTAYTINGSTTFTNVPTDSTLTATATITDSYTSATKNAVLPTVAVTMDFYKDGKGIAMGKVAETSGLFEVDWKSKFNKAVSIEVPSIDSFSITRTDSGNAATIKFANKNGALGYVGMTNNANEGLRRWTYDTSTAYTILDTGNTKDYVVEQGTSGIWTYRKWNSGVAECWGAYTGNIAITKTWGSMYYSDSLTPRINYPFTFTSRPIENVTFRGSSIAGWMYCEAGGFSLNSTTQTAQYGVCRPTSITAAELKFDFYVIGKWK